ncbi:MAG: hypothetical protein AAF974_01460 [Cyanobacteria bacterium P01_E01_bin.34]
MTNYRDLQLKLKEYRAAGFAVPALSAKYASLLRSYQRIQSILQGQSCELPAFTEVVPLSRRLDALRYASPEQREKKFRQRQSVYQWLLMGISLPLSVVLFAVVFPVVCFQELRKQERSSVVTSDDWLGTEKRQFDGSI